MTTRTPTSPVSIRQSSSSKLSSGLKKASGAASSPSNKNLSHVPCKFFKQGACQAGNSCPFSHTMDPVDQAPCKYFQKGNCKFGSKCALAHILPDGRRVNTRGAQNGQNGQNGQHNQSGQQSAQLSGQSGQSGPSTQSDHLSGQSGQSSGQLSNQLSCQSSLFGQSLSTAPTYPSINSPPGISTRSVPHSVATANNVHPEAKPHDRLKNIYSPIEASSPYSRSFADGIFTSPMGSVRSVSSSNLWPNVRHTTSRHALSLFPPDDFAIDDDDPFEEDFVPSSLTDLLTPQERKRRGSRPSSSLAHTLPSSGIHPDIWGSAASTSSPRLVRQSFSETASASPLRVLQPIGTPDRISSITAAMPGFNNTSNYSNLLSPKPVTTRRDRERDILREDDNHETQFFMEEEIAEQEKRLQDLRLVNEQLY